MNREKDIVKRDKCLIAILKEHNSRDKIIKAEEIVKELESLGFEVTTPCVRSRIGDLMYQNWLPIVYVNHHGYYWATKREDIEACVRGIEACVRGIESTIQGLEKRLRHLKSFLPE